MLTKESKILIKNVWESKMYGVTRLIKEFSNKKWNRRGVEDFLKRLRSTRSTEREHPVVDVVNHAIDEWKTGSVVCRPVSTLNADILSITYDCYSQNNNVKMANVNVIIEDYLFCSLLL